MNPEATTTYAQHMSTGERGGVLIPPSEAVSELVDGLYDSPEDLRQEIGFGDAESAGESDDEMDPSPRHAVACVQLLFGSGRATAFACGRLYFCCCSKGGCGCGRIHPLLSLLFVSY